MGDEAGRKIRSATVRNDDIARPVRSWKPPGPPTLRRPGRKARPVYSVCRQCWTYFRLQGTRPQKHCSRSCAKKAWWESVR